MTKATGVTVYQCQCRVCIEDLDPEVTQRHKNLNYVLAYANERQKRLTVGMLSQQKGGPSDLELAQMTGLDPKTIYHGRRELASGGTDLSPARQRQAGGGRLLSEKKIPNSNP